MMKADNFLSGSRFPLDIPGKYDRVPEPKATGSGDEGGNGHGGRLDYQTGPGLPREALEAEDAGRSRQCLADGAASGLLDGVTLLNRYQPDGWPLVLTGLQGAITHLQAMIGEGGQALMRDILDGLSVTRVDMDGLRRQLDEL